MLSNIATTIMLFCIVAVVKVSKSQTDCDRGWFGEKCRFRCHCPGSRPCDMNGDCASDDRCSAGFFGPGCQYVDLAVTSTSVTNRHLIDENEDTCNNKNDTLRLTWDKGVIFSWLRMYVSNKNNLHNFTVKLNNDVQCPNKKTFTVSSTTVDVTCDFPLKVFTLDVVGAVAADVCSIYISGGRNVALRQPVNQTSTFNNGPQSQASNAVDGDINPTYEEGHCTHTDMTLGEVEWSLFFNRPYTIYKIIVYNRFVLRHRLQGFTLLMYNEIGQLAFSYNEERDPNLLSFDIQSTSRESMTILKIRLTNRTILSRRILTVCEVEAFGEVACPEGYYGLSCEKQCTCQGGEDCFTVTGACTAGCPFGRYGFNCSRECGPNCLRFKCGQRTGACLNCYPGYRGAYCSSMCELGTYGINCEQNCSKNCQTPCDITDGFCQCHHPYVGKTCSECMQTLYGENCTGKCPRSCAAGVCHKQTGECASCRGAMIGAFCNDCPPGLYGALCLEPCSEFCYNDTCDDNSGACSPCTHGFSGSKCTNAPVSVSLTHLFVAIGVSGLISLLGVCFFLMKANDDDDDDDEGRESGNYDDERASDNDAEGSYV